MRSLTAFYISNFSAGFYFDELRFYNKFSEYTNENFDYILTANSKLIDLEFKNNIAIVYMNSPKELNCLSKEMRS